MVFSTLYLLLKKQTKPRVRITSMKLIIGLGNPGEKYKNNRHNVGFMVLDELAKILRVERFTLSHGVKAQYAWTSLKGIKIELFKPQTFMNSSGDSVIYAYKKHSEITLDNVYVIHDDLDIKLGDYKITKGKGPKEHKGLLSIYAKLRSQNFWHVRVGVDNRGEDTRIPGEKYVLQDFSEEELEVLGKAIDKITKELINQLTR